MLIVIDHIARACRIHALAADTRGQVKPIGFATAVLNGNAVLGFAYAIQRIEVVPEDGFGGIQG